MADNYNVINATAGTIAIAAFDTTGGSVYANKICIVDATATYTQPTGDAAARSLYTTITDRAGGHTMPAGDSTARPVYTTLANGANATPAGDSTARPIFVEVTDGTHTLPAGDSVARPIYTEVTDGTHTLPTGDSVARPIFVEVTDGTHTLPAGDSVARPIYTQITNGAQTLPTGDSVARPIFVEVTNGTQTLPSGDAAARPIYITPAPSTTGGCSKVKIRDLAATVSIAKASAGTLYGVVIVNNVAAIQFLQIFDATTASVSLGTTTPDLEYSVPANSSSVIQLPEMGVNFATAISMASTTSEKGTTGSSAGMEIFAFYQ